MEQDYFLRHCNQPFAALVPLSADAAATIKGRYNTSLINLQSTLFPVQALPNHKKRLIRMDFASLFSRRCFSFSSSRSNNIQLPKANNICLQHFILFFNIDTRLLCIKDTSSYGIWVSSPENTHSPTTHLLQAAIPVSSSVLLHFSNRGRFRFRLHLFLQTHIHYKGLFNRLFNIYARSIRHTTILNNRNTLTLLNTITISKEESKGDYIIQEQQFYMH